MDDANEFLSKLKSNAILGGIKVDDKHILIATTEMISDEDIDTYIKCL